MTTEEQNDVLAFCDLVRRLSHTIARLHVEGKPEESASTALLLCTEQAKFKRRLLGQAEPVAVDEDEDRLDLSALNRDFGQNGRPE